MIGRKEMNLHDNKCNSVVKDINSYVTWDGRSEDLYIENKYVHDCIVSSNGDLVSIRKIRHDSIIKGHNPAIIFACKSGMPAHEVEINGICHGVFSYCWLEILRHYPDISCRSAIAKINCIGSSQQTTINNRNVSVI